MNDHFIDTLCADAGSWPDHDQRNQKDKRHDDLACKHDKRVDSAEGLKRDIHLESVEGVGSCPQDTQGKPHHDQHDDRRENGNHPAGEDLNPGKLHIDLVKLVFLIGLCIEGSHNPDACQVLS